MILIRVQLTMKMLLMFYFLFTFIIKPLPGGAATIPVLDIRGKKVRTGVDYYILPVFRGRGGGLTLGQSARNGTLCPLNVVQEQQEVDSGLPLRFLPVNNTKRRSIVPISTDLNIKFESVSTICIQSTVWKLDDYDELTGQWFVASGGSEGNPGRESISNWFKIDKFGEDSEDYKIRFCPSVCDYCKVMCRNVGIYIQNEKRYLALSDEPFKIMFKRADDDDTTATATATAS